MRSAQVFAACNTGPSTMEIVASSSLKRVKRGGAFWYIVKLRRASSAQRKAPLDLGGLALSVVLPAGTRFKKGAVSPKRRMVVPDVSNGTVTWPLSSLSGRSSWKIGIKLRTDSAAPAPSSLTVTATVSQVNGADLSICPRVVNNVTVAIK